MPTVITGTDGVSQVQTGAVESGDLPAGSVIQVVQIQSQTEVATTSTSPVDIGLNLAITPTLVNSKFIGFVKVFAEFDQNGSLYGGVFFRDSSIIFEPNAVENGEGSITGSRTCSHLQFIDTPNTLNEVTYSCKPKTGGGGVMKFNQGGNSNSIMTIMEIAG